MKVRDSAHSAVRSGLDTFQYRMWEPFIDKLSQRRGFRRITVNGTSLEFISRTAEEIKLTRLRERDVLDDFLDELDPEDTVFDIGACYGLYSCFAASIVENGTVHSFEPNPANYDLLIRNATHNSVAVETHQVALHDTQKTVHLELPKGNERVSGGGAITTSSESGSFAVSADTGDNLVVHGSIPQPNVVKLDVEGAEPLVVRGMRETLENPRCRLLYCEVHCPDTENSLVRFGTTLEEFFGQLNGLGFDCELLREPRAASNIPVKATK